MTAAIEHSDKVGKGEIDTLEKLAELDSDEIVRGYMAGLDDATVPIAESKSFYHGWLNAQVDRGRMQSSEAQRRLAYEYVRRPR